MGGVVGGQDGCERRIGIFVKIHKNGGSGGVGGRGRLGGGGGSGWIRTKN